MNNQPARSETTRWCRALVLVVLLIGGSSAIAQKLLGPPSDASPDYKQGWCEGWLDAQKAVMQNRDHLRHRLESEVPFETHAEAIKRIYVSPQKTPPASIVASVAGTVADSIDLYVVLPPVKCVMHDGYMSLEFQSER